MKALFRKFFSPVLNLFEQGDEDFICKPHSRKILVFISILFSGLAAAVYYFIPAQSEIAYYLPVLIFGGIALIGFIVGLLGTDRAVAKIWGSR